MIIWTLCRVSRLKEVYQRLPLLSSITKINKIPQRYNISLHNEALFGRDKKKIKKFMSIDNIPKDSQLVYNCAISKLIVFAYNSSWFLLIFILSGIYYYTDSELDYPLYEPDQNDGSTLHNITIYSEVEHYMIYLFLLCYNVFGFVWCRRTALRIWHHNDKYYMILPKLVSKSGRQVIVKPGDMSLKYKFVQIPLIKNVHVMNGWKYYINEENFMTPLEYFKFIGEST
ncbi:uncharacterized protein [Chelonus insularis]|uniref:uncharacterized protein n=1 Tax=Chelonus insularis TaxID=460826 RepID=UPI00158EF220|nr:uncharacterized protein LOC118071949 [Chelonus insularis]XP_034947343.1 uncharacterized protein LOC118071949 [Chelonus insularis]